MLLLLLLLHVHYLFYRKKSSNDEDEDDDDEPTTVPKTTYRNQYKNIAAVHKAVGYASRAKTHAGRSNAMTKCTRMGVEQANRNKLARKDRGSASKSYDLDIPADAVVALTGWLHGVRNYQCPWYIPSSSWPPGLEDDLLDLAIPYYRSQKAAVDNALLQYTTHTERSERCLATSAAALESLRHNVISALLASASRPVSRKLELHKNAQPMYLCRKHPVFWGGVFKSEQYKILAKMVVDKQNEFERQRIEKANDPLTKASLGDIITSVATAVKTTIRECIPASADGAAATTGAPATTDTAATGADAAAAAPARTGTAAATSNVAATAAPTGVSTAAAATVVARPQKKKKISHKQGFAKYWAENGTVLEADGVPRYVQNMGLTTISLIWKEYKHGLEGSKSLEWLETNAKGWRSYSQGYTAWNRRKEIYLEMNRMMDEDKLTESAAVSNLQERLDSFPKKGTSTGPDLVGFNAMLKAGRKRRSSSAGGGTEEEGAETIVDV